MAKKQNIKQTILNHVEDFFIVSGLIAIIAATFMINTIAGIYAIGVVLFGIGWYLTLP
ncbi:DUF1056 family protein [Cohnella sp. WQ 127256]|uniref:DUF1056 family protein n=1 Tax=Cohnella sp. WQ 127256 TaxID=2938790 RepID=UPI002117B590|nr:DUF1056 family protein [Cohnella sp. WQ 127256]